MDLNKEEWKDIPGFEGYYQASTTGKIWSIKSKKEIGKPDSKNRCSVRLCRNGYISKNHQTARWIAITFPELVANAYFEGAVIDHINTDPTDNRPSNLRWTTYKGNSNNQLTKEHLSNSKKGTVFTKKHRKALSLAHIGKPNISRSKEVIQYNVDGQFIALYKSGCEAQRKTGVSQGKISACALGKRKTAGNKDGRYIWRYV